MIKNVATKDVIERFLSMEPNPFGPPDGAGVYGIFVAHTRGHERLVYIGSSKNISKRILSPNHVYRLLFDRMMSRDFMVYSKSMLTDDYLQQERVLIRHFKPLLNKQYNGK